jgi:MFS-type transporter involved in bile tolerance (Atg22 family)
MASITTPIVIGFILQATKSFELALVYVAVLAGLGALSYLFIVQDIHRVELDPSLL